MVEICNAVSASDLEGIKYVQEANLRRNLSETEALLDGFILAEFDIDFLEKITRHYPIIIAKEEGCVVGYALIVSNEIGREYAFFHNKLEKINKVVYKGTPLEKKSYVFCAQLCVAASHRGQGIMGQFYDKIRQVVYELTPEITICVADVAVENKRSLRAHEKYGFKTIDAIKCQETPFNVIVWDWNQNSNVSQ